MSDRLFIKAYETNPSEGYALEPAPTARDWMERLPRNIPKRCLPLTMANRAGWVVRTPVGFKATWGGKTESASLKIEVTDGEERLGAGITNSFGSGIISFVIPWLFRTSPGIGMLVRGPTNFSVDGATPLDGFVETDWSPYTFTMNWRVLRRNKPVFFKKGDPFVMLTPFPTDLLERFDVQFASLESDPELKAQREEVRMMRINSKEKWRQAQIEAAKTGDEAKTSEPEFGYLKGKLPSGYTAPPESHRTNFKLDRFD